MRQDMDLLGLMQECAVKQERVPSRYFDQLADEHPLRRLRRVSRD